LDGILCHDGEIHNQRLEPLRAKTFETLESEMAAKQNNPAIGLTPMTLEGCVVRMADTVSYIGRDIEDAIRMNMILRSDLPAQSVKVLGSTNGTIVYRLVMDIIQNSFQNTYTAFSPEVSDALESLKAFNLERIYMSPKIKSHTVVIRNLFHLLFERYLLDIEKENQNSVIFSGFLKDMSVGYLHCHRPAEIVRDFIAGMTDRYFLAQCPENLRPSSQPF
jgi:dGTPase